MKQLELWIHVLGFQNKPKFRTYTGKYEHWVKIRFQHVFSKFASCDHWFSPDKYAYFDQYQKLKEDGYYYVISQLESIEGDFDKNGKLFQRWCWVKVVDCGDLDTMKKLYQMKKQTKVQKTNTKVNFSDFFEE